MVEIRRVLSDVDVWAAHPTRSASPRLHSGQRGRTTRPAHRSGLDRSRRGTKHHLSLERANDAAAEGIAISRELLQAVAGRVAGVYFIPPFGRYDVIAQTLDGLELPGR